MKQLQSIVFNHKNLPLNEIGKLHIENTEIGQRLTPLLTEHFAKEVMLLSTCNRVEFLLASNEVLDAEYVHAFLRLLYPHLDVPTISQIASQALLYTGEDAVQHLFQVASSLDSLVVGEREIITQVRHSYETCKAQNLPGDMIRLVVQKGIETAKKIFTHTAIAKNPVSIVSLAYRKLKNLHIKLDARFLIIGAGVTNTNFSKYLKKHGFKNFHIYNRTAEKALQLAAELGGQGHALSKLPEHTAGFDVLICCTGSSDAIVTPALYKTLLGNDNAKKVVIDLALPNDLDERILQDNDISYVSIHQLKDLAEKNLREREKELAACEVIINLGMREFTTAKRERKVELAMGLIPKKVREIRDTAINEVFVKEIEALDQPSKELLDKVINYMEKKYISVPMKMAKDILIDEAGAH